MAQYPDILSAPAPILRNEDLLVDDETVVFGSPDTQSQAQRYPPSTITTNMNSSKSATTYENYSPSTSSSMTYSPSASLTPSPRQPWTSSLSPSSHRDTSSALVAAASTSTYSAYDPYSENPRPSSGAIIPHVSHDASSKVSRRPPEVSQMRTRRKVATATAGVCGGLVGLAVLGPVGAVAGGVGGAMLTKSVGKRRERKRTEQIAAQRHAAEERQFGREIQAYQSEVL